MNAKRVLVPLLVVGLLAAQPVYPRPAQDGPSALERHALRAADVARAVQRARARPVAALPTPLRTLRGGPVPQAGDLVTSAGSLARAIRIVQKNRRGRIVRDALAEAFVSRGIAHDALTGLVAIAAVDRVVLYEPATGALTSLREMGGGETLQFANDVLFDDEGLLIIADQGASATGKEPTDGRLWQYDPTTGAVKRLAGRRKLSNPSLLAADSSGRVHLVDSEAGSLLSPLLGVRWDLVFRLRGAKRKGARRVFNGEGLQATAFDIGPDDRMWFGNVSEIAILDGKQLLMPCPVGELPFEFIGGMAVLGEDEARVADGADVITPRRWIYDVDDDCSARIRFKGRKLNGIRGLAPVVAPPGE